MMKGREFLVYLAGPISGLTYDEGQDWRDYVAQEFPEEIHALSPLRGKQRLLRAGVIDGSYEEHPLTSQQGITARDRNDCMRSDAVLFNLLGAKKESIGTSIEFGWVDAFRKPIIVAMEPSGNPHDHPIIRAIAGYRVETLDKAIELVTTVLLPDGGTPREYDRDTFYVNKTRNASRRALLEVLGE